MRSDTTYYGQPIIKESAWSLDIPLYYFLGAAAGAALTLGASMQLAAGGRKNFRDLSARCHWIGIIGSTAEAALLIHDLERPSRFLYMLRVFLPTSSMNLGAWILGGAVPAAITTGLFINRRGWTGALGQASHYLSGIFGAALAGYTGVLVSNSVLPVWQPARRWLPVLFIASAATTAASVLDLFPEHSSAWRVTQVFGTAGRVAELASAERVSQLASAIPEVGAPFHRGGPAVLWKSASFLTAASLAASLLPHRARTKWRIAGLLEVAGSLCLRLAIHYLGNASARDARATFQQQRDQLASKHSAAAGEASAALESFPEPVQSPAPLPR